jgi:hypothetical protein
MTAKYVVQNGKAVLNPAYVQEQKKLGVATTMPSNPQALTFPSTLEDQTALAEVTRQDMPPSFAEAMSTIQSDEYGGSFGNQTVVDGGDLLDGLTRVFARYEIPIGMLPKAIMLNGKAIDMLIDNSGSMTRNSDLTYRDASDYMRQQLANDRRFKKTTFHDGHNQVLTRWEDAQDRLHILIELLAYIPTYSITLRTFVHPNNNPPALKIVLDRSGKTPEEFIAYAHQQITQLFRHPPSEGTPIYNNMVSMFNEADQLHRASDVETMHYIFTDGEPTGEAFEIDQIKNLLETRNPDVNTVTMIGCSNKKEDYDWLLEMEEVASKVAALADYVDEKTQVTKAQGAMYPYTRGMWLACNLAAALNPEDLNKMDQRVPFTRRTLESNGGRGLMNGEYELYFRQHPAARVFQADFQQFNTVLYGCEIQSVMIYRAALKQGLDRDIDNGNDDTQEFEINNAEQAVTQWRRSAPAPMYATTPTQYQGSMYPQQQQQQQQPQQYPPYQPAPYNPYQPR